MTSQTRGIGSIASRLETRDEIERLLGSAGWDVQDHEHFDPTASAGIAAHGYPLGTGFADYLLFVEGRIAGIVEAGTAGLTTSAVCNKLDERVAAIAAGSPQAADPPLFQYGSSGAETQFRDARDVDARFRRVFASTGPRPFGPGWMTTRPWPTA